MATLADLVGVKPPAGKDSISYLPTLTARPQAKTHDYVVVNNHFNQMGHTALISRDGWKLVEINRTKNQFQLYDLKEDNETARISIHLTMTFGQYIIVGDL